MRLLVVALGLVIAMPHGWLASPLEAGQTARIEGSNTVTTIGRVIGVAWRADNTPLPGARLRLRNVSTGHAVAATTSDANGEFRFDRVGPGAYVVELMADDDVAALSELFGMTSNETIATFVRLSARSGWFDGFFTNAAVAAIATASSLGVTAVGSSGLPASPQ